MKVSVYHAATAFQQRVQASLEEQELINSVMIGVVEKVAAGFSFGNQPPYLATVEEKSDLITVAVMTPPLNLQISAPHGPDNAAFEALAFNLLENDVEIPGVIGPAELSGAFESTWERLACKNGRLNKELGLYALTKVTPPALCSGNFRQAAMEEVDRLASWLVSFELESLGRQEQADTLRAISTRILEGNLFVWEDSGKIVAMSAKARSTRNTTTVNLVYTPPVFRGKGYASNLVAQVSQLILDAGKRYSLLYTDLANPISNSIYQKIGYRPVCNFDEYRFD